MSQITSSRLPTLPYTAREFMSIQDELLRYIQATRGSDINSFFEGDVGKILVEMLAYTHAILSYSIDRVSEEGFIATMRTRAAALIHAAGLAYPVATPNGASAVLCPVSYNSIPPEFSASNSVNESQQISFSNAPTAGTFTLTFDNGNATETSVPIPFDATGADIQRLLEGITLIGQGNVSVTGPSRGPWIVTFINELRFTAFPLVTINTSQLTRNDVQRVLFSGNPTGSYTLTFNGQTTPSISINATAAQLRSALLNLSNIDVNDVTVTGTSANSYYITFAGQYASTDVPQMTINNGGLSGGSGIVATVTNGAPVSAIVTRQNQGVNNTWEAVFSKGTSFTNGATRWEVAANTTIDGADVTPDNFQDVFRVPVVEGATFQETFESDGSTFQSFTTSNTSVIAASLVVQIGSQSNTEWKRLDTLALADANDEAFTVRYDSNGSAIISFGDGITGKIPPNGSTIFVTARTGGGLAGNVNANTLNTSLSATKQRGSTTSGQLSVPLTNITNASGGREAESIEEIRRNIPAWLRTVDKAITKEDYDTLARRFSGNSGAVSRAVSYLESATIAFTRSGIDASPSAPLTVPKGTQFTLGPGTFVLSKDIVFRESDPILFLSPNAVSVYIWSASETSFAPSTEALVSECRAYLQERSVITTTLRVYPGRVKKIDIDLGEIRYFNGFKRQDVSEGIISAVRAFFLSDSIQPGQPFRISDFYHAIDSVDGVDHFVIRTPSSDIETEKDELFVLGNLLFTLREATPVLDADANEATFGNELFE